MGRFSSLPPSLLLLLLCRAYTIIVILYNSNPNTSTTTHHWIQWFSLETVNWLLAEMAFSNAAFLWSLSKKMTVHHFLLQNKIALQYSISPEYSIKALQQHGDIFGFFKTYYSTTLFAVHQRLSACAKLHYSSWLLTHCGPSAYSDTQQKPRKRPWGTK